jgi:hypothetical protein
MSEEKRRYKRLQGDATAFIELMGPSVDAPEGAPIIMCDSVDMSQGGVRVCIDTHIDPGTILHLGLQLVGQEKPLYVVAAVRWAQQTEAGEDYYIGFELLESDGTDLELWRSLLQKYTDAT